MVADPFISDYLAELESSKYSLDTAAQRGSNTGPYDFPLADRHRLLIADIALWWSQIDTQLNTILFIRYGLTRETFNNLFSKAMFGTKISAVQADLSAIPDSFVKARVSEAIAYCNKLSGQRNVVFHGMWGWTWHKDEGQWLVAAWNQQKEKLFYLRDLRILHSEVKYCALAMDMAMKCVVYGPQNLGLRWQVPYVGIDEVEGLPPVPTTPR